MAKINNKQKYFGDLPSNYLVNHGKEELIKKDKYGNCRMLNNNIEANACSMIKDDYDKSKV